MKNEIIVSGFGGQGVLSIGKMIAEAGNIENLAVSWLPSYGPEMRGGTANCTVVVADSKIGSPLTDRPDILIALNRPSLDKYMPMVRPGGLMIVNQPHSEPTADFRDDIRVVVLDSSQIAMDLGNLIVANVVMFGAFVALSGVVSMDTARQVLKETFTGRKEKLLDLNFQALEAGANSVKETQGA